MLRPAPPYRLTIVLFIVYIIVICWILLFKLGVEFSYMKKRSVNLVPFNEPSILTLETILNVVIFIPLGIYAGMLLLGWTFIRTLLFIFSFSLAVESLQYFMRIGAFDVTDLITNTVGGVIGWLLFKAVSRTLKNSDRTHKILNIITATGTILIILMLALLRMNMLPVRYQ